jgi:DNA invertase Pin-like site-specific DNA recombinase
MPIMNKAIAYIRAGSADNLACQREELLAKLGDIYEITGEYLDTSSSTQGVGDRSALKKLVEDATNGEFDVLLCTDLTRLTRQVTPGIIMAFRKAGVRIVTGDGSEVGIADLVLATMPRTFVEAQGERIKAGKRAVRERRRAERRSDEDKQK